MLDERYLICGLDALSRAHETDYFADGHRGAAMVASYFLCREHEVEEGAARSIGALMDQHWTGTDLCAPFPQEEPDEALLDRVLRALEANIGVLRQVGHNVVFASLALRAFHERPETLTPSRVDGICRLMARFDTAHDFTADEDDALSFDDPHGLAEYILSEFPRCAQAFVGRGQGWTGHLLTFGRALSDIALLGHADLAAKGRHALGQYVARIRMGPLETDTPRPERPPSRLCPLELAYWDERRGHDVGIGHCFKYPYGFYSLLALARDPDLKRQCLAEAFRIF